MPVIGIDFGTTNSALCVTDADGEPRLARFSDGDALTDTFRSILFFSAEPPAADQPRASAGPSAIREYLGAGGAGRLIQSLKSFLGDRGFHSTNIFEKNKVQCRANNSTNRRTLPPL